MSALPNAEDILLNEIITQKYLSVDRINKRGNLKGFSRCPFDYTPIEEEKD